MLERTPRYQSQFRDEMAAHSSTVSGSAAVLDVEADERVQREARVKPATKDADEVQRYRGMRSPVMSNVIFDEFMSSLNKGETQGGHAGATAAAAE
jgi:hypothetical protein